MLVLLALESTNMYAYCWKVVRLVHMCTRKSVYERAYVYTHIAYIYLYAFMLGPCARFNLLTLQRDRFVNNRAS